MPIKFISLNKNFIDQIKTKGFEAYFMQIQSYRLVRKTYFVSPANSFGFMGGGIDVALNKYIFPDIEPVVQYQIKHYACATNLIGKKYLPIGSSIIIDYNKYRSLVVSPTMLMPDNVSDTQNAYYATIATLYNILENRKEDINNVDIILTSMCCGIGAMSDENSITQILKAVNDYKIYKPKAIDKNCIFNEPNLNEQPYNQAFDIK